MSLLPEGKHEVEVVDAYMTESQSGTPGLVFRFENLEGHQECIRYITPNTTDRVIEDLETMGFPRAKLSDMANLDKLKDFIKGNSVRIVVKDEEYQGKTTPKVAWINKSGAMKKETPDVRANIFALLNGKAPALMSAPRSRAAAPATSEPPPNTPFTEDQEPF
jgi:hypothetical protein